MGMIGLSCYILADTFFVSKGLGTNGLTALNLAIPIYSFIHGSGLMIGMGGGTKYSIFKSQDHHFSCECYFYSCCCTSRCFCFYLCFDWPFLFAINRDFYLVHKVKSLKCLTLIYRLYYCLRQPFY